MRKYECDGRSVDSPPVCDFSHIFSVSPPAVRQNMYFIGVFPPLLKCVCKNAKNAVKIICGNIVNSLDLFFDLYYNDYTVKYTNLVWIENHRRKGLDYANNR